MTGAGNMEREPEGDDLRAAEYVLGVQTAQERAETARRIDEEPDFARLVDAWEARLEPLAGEFAEVAPPAAIKQRIDRLVSASSSHRAKPGLWSSLAMWRGLALAAVAALVALTIVPLVSLKPPAAPSQMMASLSAEGSDVRYMVMLDERTGRIGLSHVSGDRPSDHDFELWVIRGDAAPRSLGVVPVGQSARMAPEDGSMVMEQGDVLAISLEPTGGSPTGQPTGPVVAAGGLHDI